MSVPIITIDGPSGSGKGTVCRKVADVLNWHLLDSGALYRLTALAARKAGLPFEETPVAELASNLNAEFRQNDDGSEAIYLDNQDVTSDIRSETCGEDASQVAVFPAVRAALIARQKAYATWPGLVADGRDMGTQIFTDAGLKIFLTASAAERAERRYKQLKENNIDVSLPALLQEIEQRDKRDASRAVAPLVPAPDAHTIDSTGIDADAVVAIVLELKNRTFGLGSS